jgi:hypothetical protein
MQYTIRRNLYVYNIGIYFISQNISLPVSGEDILGPSDDIIVMYLATQKAFLQISHSNLTLFSIFEDSVGEMPSYTLTTKVSFEIFVDGVIPTSDSILSALNESYEGISFLDIFIRALVNLPSAQIDTHLQQIYEGIELGPPWIQTPTSTPTESPRIDILQIETASQFSHQSIVIVVIFSAIALCILIALMIYCHHERNLRYKRVSFDNHQQAPISPAINT